MRKKELEAKLLTMQRVNEALIEKEHKSRKNAEYQRRLRKNEKRILVKNIHRASNGLGILDA